ncbi:MAG: hypothetical protein IT379_04905 [Deltaproteobacteria bacterium]|nr:hypothetical protein [Deltaproteobacteria bacterium]
MFAFFVLASSAWTACAEDGDGSAAACAGASTVRPFAVVAASTYTGGVGAYAFVPVDDPGAVATSCGRTSSDPVVRASGDRVFVLDRYRYDTLTVLDASRPGLPLVSQTSVADAPGADGVRQDANPWDALLLPDGRLYVTRWEQPTLAVVDPTAGALVGAIDLAPYADADGIPEMGWMALSRGRVFVALQRLDRTRRELPPAGPGLVVVLDPATDSVVATIELAHGNPATPMIAAPDDPEDLLVATSGLYRSLFEAPDSDGSIQRIDTESFTVSDPLLTESELGGDLVDWTTDLDGRRVFAVVGDTDLTRVVELDLASGGAPGEPLHTSSGFDLKFVRAGPDGRLWIGDRTRSSPRVVLVPMDGASASSPTSVPLELPPVDLAFVR